MEPGQSNRVGRYAFGAMLFAALAGALAFAWTQQRAASQLRAEKLALEERIKELDQQRGNPTRSTPDQSAEVQKLREDNQDLLRLRSEITRLREQLAAAGVGTNETRGAQASDIEKLREDNKDVLRLRNELRQLREQAAELESLRAANSRFLQSLQDGNISNMMASVTAVRKQGSLLGVEIITASSSGTQAYRGALVGNIMPDSPVAQSGLKSGDIIFALDGRPIESGAQLQAEMLTKKPGETVMLDVMRNDQSMRVPVQTRAWP